MRSECFADAARQSRLVRSLSGGAGGDAREKGRRVFGPLFKESTLRRRPLTMIGVRQRLRVWLGSVMRANKERCEAPGGDSDLCNEST